QRAMTAMALACEPKLLIADEPTTALDVTTQAEILDLIKELQTRYGMALMFITHDMGVVAEIADEVAVMQLGKVVEQGPVDRIFHDPQHPYTRHLLGSVLKLETRAHRAAQAPPPAATTPAVLTVENLSMHFAARRRAFGRPRHETVKAL